MHKTNRLAKELTKNGILRKIIDV